MNIKDIAAALALAAGLALAACQSEPIRNLNADFQSLFGSAKGEPALAAGLKQYEDGSYNDAAKQIQSALSQGLSTPDRVKAHKYLAFIDCVTDRVPACRDEFRKALAIDPSLELAPAEAGHPIWGPVFRSVKSGSGR
jgi:Tfp pilus assembly protein PilF